MLSLVFSGYLLVTIIMCFIRIRIGLSMFLFYSILVPFMKFFDFGQNIFPFFIILALFYNYDYKKLIYKPLTPFLFLYATQLIFILFHDEVPESIQLDGFRVSFMSTLLLPFAMINVMLKDSKALSLFHKTLVFAIVIDCSYSLYLATIPGLNPYLLVVMPLSGSEFNDAYALAEDQGRVFGRISGVFPHPMTNGLFLSFSLIFILSKVVDNYIGKNTKTIYLFFVPFIFLAIFVIGVRSAIGATVVGVGVYFVMQRRFKLLIYALIGGGLFFVVLQQIPGMEDFIKSMFDSQSSKVSGSSLEMRIAQFNGALDEIKSNPLFGKGYGWTKYYHNLRGDHPVLLAFESIIYIILCEDGFVGMAFWIIMLMLYYSNVKKHFQRNYASILISLMVVYIAYAIITGEYGYMKYLLLFYSIMWAYGINKYPINKIKTNIRYE